MTSHGFIQNESFPDIILYTMVINVCNGSITCNEHSNFEQIMEYLISPTSNCSKKPFSSPFCNLFWPIHQIFSILSIFSNWWQSSSIYCGTPLHDLCVNRFVLMGIKMSDDVLGRGAGFCMHSVQGCFPVLYERNVCRFFCLFMKYVSFLTNSFNYDFTMLWEKYNPSLLHRSSPARTPESVPHQRSCSFADILSLYFVCLKYKGWEKAWWTTVLSSSLGN